MNEALQFSRLAAQLLSELEEICESVDNDAAIRSRCNEAILTAFSQVDDIVSLRKTTDGTEAERFDDPADQIN